MIEIVARHLMPAALALLPADMNTPAARAMLLAIGLQESRFRHRRQIINGGSRPGPAAGFWQFERGGGVRGVMKHEATRGHAIAVLRSLRYDRLAEAVSFQMADIHGAIENNDVLACAFARLLLWTLPDTLPGRGEQGRAWAQYLDAWRPGKPHPATWADFYTEAWVWIDREEQTL